MLWCWNRCYLVVSLIRYIDYSGSSDKTETDLTGGLTILLVIPDTNALYSDPFLEGVQVKTILVAESHTDIRLVIPELVIDELRNHVEERLRATIKDADKVRRDYATLSGLDPYSVGIMISSDQRKAVLDRFDRRIQQLVEEGRILSYPTPSPKELAHRSIKVKAPFQGKDRGMRDTLVWLTAKGRAVQGAGIGSKIALVAEDKAFWDKDKRKLAEGLEGELKDAGVPLDTITLHHNLQDVIRTFVSGKLPHVEWVRVAIEGGRVDDFTACSDTVLLEVTDWIVNNPDILEVGGYLFVDFDIIGEVTLCSVEQVLDLGNGEILVDSKWICNVAAEGYDNPHFGHNLSVELEFDLSSIIKVDNDLLTVSAHEVADIEVVGFTSGGIN